MAHPVTNDYETVIYSGESDNRLRLKFNGVEVETAGAFVDKVIIKSRVMANGSKRFSLGDFISKEVEIVMHDFDVEEILDPVEIYIGTKVGENYEDVKIGVFNIQSKPLGDDGKINLKLRDNSVKLDFPYNAKPLMDGNDGVATKRQILEDIGTTFGVTINVPTFLGEDEEVGIYDNTINGRTYVSYLAEQAGKIAQINRDGAIVFIDVKNLKTWVIDPNIVESFKENKTYKISKTIYEDAIRKYVDGNDTHDKLFLDSANPYISSQEQVEDIHSTLNNFEISSFTTGKILGNPAIDPWDLISITWEGKTYVTFANSVLTYEINMIQTFDTRIGEEAREVNVTLIGEPSFRKWAKTTIDNIEGTINFTVGKTDVIEMDLQKTINTQSDISTNVENIKKDVDEVKDESSTFREDIDGLTEQLGDINDELSNEETGVKSQLSYIEQRTTDIEIDIDGLKTSRSYSGGYNLIENCVKQFGQAGWSGNHINFTNTEIKDNSLTKSALVFMDGIEEREIQTENEKHNFSFKYKKLVELADVTITVNDIELELDVYDEWVVVDVTVPISNNLVTIKYYSDTDNSVWLVNPLLIPGAIRQIWTPNPNEIHTGVIKLGGEVLTIESDTAKTIFEATTDGTRVLNKDTNKRVAEFTDKGVETANIKGQSGEVAKLAFIDVGKQTWLVRR